MKARGGCSPAVPAHGAAALLPAQGPEPRRTPPTGSPGKGSLWEVYVAIKLEPILFRYV